MLAYEQKPTKPLLMQGLFLCLISLTYYWISLPGLQGGFTLDDFPNLENLGQVKDLNGLLQFILNGISSTLGRPFSLLSFALQAEHWPHNPFPFKVVGLVIHLINAWLVFFCCYLIAKLKYWPERSCFIFAGTVFGLWLFHPLNISTVFYVVQRMTLLAALFSLLGVAGFLLGLRLSVSGQVKKGLIIATIGMCITYVLGILSKENAVLTGLGIAVLYWLLLRPQYQETSKGSKGSFSLRDDCTDAEGRATSGTVAEKVGMRGLKSIYTLHPHPSPLPEGEGTVRNSQNSSLWDKWIVIFGVMPSLIILTYLCFHLDQHTRAEFTPYQRLLTESVILLDYVDKILLPTPYKLNIFNDGFPVYKDLFAELITIKAVSLWLVLVSLAYFFRKNVPFFTFAVFWFLSGHLLESSIFGLELYFEHRNYLPGLGIIIGIVGTVVEIGNKAQGYPQKLQKAVNYASIGLISVLSLVYVMVYGAEVSSWKNPGSLAISALTERPNSMRAHQVASGFFVNQGDFATAKKILDTIEKRWPSTGAYAQYLMLKCFDENTPIPQEADLLQRFQQGTFDRGTLTAMTDTYTQKKQGNCQYLTWEKYLEYTEALFNNPAFAGQKDDFLILQAYTYTALKQPEKAALALDRFPNEVSSVDFLLYKANFFAVAKNIDKSLEIISLIKARFGSSIKYQITSKKMVDSMEEMLKLHQAKLHNI